jgi:translation initiation factor IF-2
LVAEDYGGDAQVVEVSGKSGEGIDVLVESLLLQADVMELRAASEGQAEATVLDANMEKGRGVVADVLVQVL